MYMILFSTTLSFLGNILKILVKGKKVLYFLDHKIHLGFRGGKYEKKFEAKNVIKYLITDDIIVHQCKCKQNSATLTTIIFPKWRSGAAGDGGSASYSPKNTIVVK